MTVPEGGTAAAAGEAGSASRAGNMTVAVARASGSDHITVQSGASLVFTTANWSSYQTVTLASARDADACTTWPIVRCSAQGRQRRTSDRRDPAGQRRRRLRQRQRRGPWSISRYLQRCLTGTGVPITDPSCLVADWTRTPG